MTKHEICSSIISLESEIEFLKEINLPTIKQKRELNKLHRQLKKISTLEKSNEEN